jgi:hypothetical protein
VISSISGGSLGMRDLFVSERQPSHNLSAYAGRKTVFPANCNKNWDALPSGKLEGDRCGTCDCGDRWRFTPPFSYPEHRRSKRAVRSQSWISLENEYAQMPYGQVSGHLGVPPSIIIGYCKAPSSHIDEPPYLVISNLENWTSRDHQGPLIVSR